MLWQLYYTCYCTNGRDFFTTNAHSKLVLLSWPQEDNSPISNQLFVSRSSITFLAKHSIAGLRYYITVFHAMVSEENAEMEVSKTEVAQNFKTQLLERIGSEKTLCEREISFVL